MKKKICAVIVTYNRLETLKRSLSCVISQSLAPDTIVIVDNASSDGTKGYIKGLENIKNIYCLYLENNIGYAGGIAHGINYAMSLEEHDYFWVMDDDSYHKKNTLEELAGNINGTQFGILGLSGSRIKLGTKYQIDPLGKTEEADYVLIDGALLNASMVSRIGVPDERFFMMCEDHEYCKRIKRGGDKVGLLNIGDIERLHMGGGGTFTNATLWRGYYQSRNHILILKEYFSFPDLLGYVIRQIKFIVAAALFAPDRFKRIKFRLIGMWHGIKGVGGKTLDPATLRFY